jgi:outer membrane murein-binding lipoprotein Lpp
MDMSYWGKAARWGGLVVLTLTLSGCDYWPPALQAQIEQLRADLQTATTERAKLESQLSETTKLKEELQARIEEMNRANRELTTRASGLEAQVHTLQEKLAKAATVKKPATAKSAKPATKPAPKKKTGRAA